MLCQFSFPVFINHTPDFFHAFDDEHLCIPKVVFRCILIFMQKCIVLFIKCIYLIQKTCKMVIDAPSPDKSIAVCIGFQLRTINKEFFERDQALFLQLAHELVIQLIQKITRQFFILEFIESIPLRFLPFGQPDKSKIPLA